MNIGIGAVEKLRKAGFSFKRWDNYFEPGMVFWYDQHEWVVGGRVFGKKIDLPDKVKQEGIWLPDAWHLELWLTENDFDFTIRYTEEYYYVEAVDSVLLSNFSAQSGTLEYALTKLICKICKKGEREFDNKIYEGPRAEIIDDYIEPS